MGRTEIVLPTTSKKGGMKKLDIIQMLSSKEFPKLVKTHLRI